MLFSCKGVITAMIAPFWVSKAGEKPARFWEYQLACLGRKEQNQKILCRISEF